MTDCCCMPLDRLLEPVEDATRVRRAAFEALRTGRAPRLGEIADHTGLDVEHVRGIVVQLVAAGIATVDDDFRGDAAVVGADGLTVQFTAHHLVLHGRRLHTWCAYDTVGIPAALGVDAVARTTCPACGSAIELVLHRGQSRTSAVVGWWPLAVSGPVNETFCPTANLFCSSEHLDSWRATTAPGPRESLNLEALAERGRQTWSALVGPGDRA